MIETAPTLSTTAGSLHGLPSFRIARKGALALGIKLVGAGLALGLQICLARSLGHAGYGQYAYVFAWLQLMLIFAQGGFSTAALRYVAEYGARGQPGLLRGFLSRSTQIVFIESTVLALLIAGYAIVFHRSDPNYSVRDILLASAALPLLSQFQLSSSVIRGLGHVIPTMLASLVQPILLLGALLAASHLMKLEVATSFAWYLYLGSAVVSLGLILSMRRRMTPTFTEGSRRCYLTGDWFGTASQMMISSVLVYLQGRTGVIISGIMLDPASAGTYAAMERLADVALLGLVSVNMLAAPKYAGLFAQQRRAELQHYARLAAWGASGFMIVAVLPFILFGKPILYCFGEEFVSGHSVLLILLGGVAVNALCGSVGFLLNMTGHQRTLVGILFVGLILNVGLSFLLVPKYGLLGTAWANTLAILFWNISMVLAVRMHLGIWPNVGRLNSRSFV